MPTYYVRDNNQFVLAKTAPTRDAFEALTGDVVVHSKMHGSHDKAQPYVLRGINRRGRLLVQTVVPTQYDPVGRWHEVEAGDTVEGYRFKRYFLKGFAALVKLGVNAAKVQVRAARTQAKLADRAEKCGTCPACFGDYVATPTKLVHHGYQRPGDGQIHGDCPGVGYPPYEVSCEGTQAYLAQTESAIGIFERQLSTFGTLTSVEYRVGGHWEHGRWVYSYATAQKGTPTFARVLAEREADCRHQIGLYTAQAELLRGKIAAWTPRPFPREVAP